MNDSLAQHPAQTPSPSTGSRQATHSVGSAMSSASLPQRAKHRGEARKAPRRWVAMERDGDAGASMGEASAMPRGAQARGHKGAGRCAHCQKWGDRRTNPAWPRTRPPRLACSTALCCESGRPCAAGEPATFLLDRVAEDMAERLHAVLREFKTAADIGTAGEQLGKRWPGASNPSRRSRARFRIGAAGAGAGFARPRGIRAGAAIRQRSAGRAGAGPPRAEAGRAVAGGNDRRRYTD